MSSSGPPRKVLLVEDEATSQLIITDILDMINLVPDVAKNAEEALDALTSRTYDLIIMDVMLPGLSGIDAAKRIREKEKATSTHALIVALTASEDPEIKKRCLDAGMDGFFAKPVKKLQFLQFLKHVLK